MFTTISTYYTFPKTIEQIRQNMTGHVTSRYQGLNSSEVGAKIENLGTRLAWRPFSAGDPGQSAPPPLGGPVYMIYCNMRNRKFINLPSQARPV
jgi:hypothetical protein